MSVQRLHERVIGALLEPILAVRARRLAVAIARHVGRGSQVLDVGCGDLLIGRALQQRAGARVQGVDVVDQNRTGLPFQLYDGVRLPFPDDSFDVVLFSFVLHHSEDQETLLAEARRVSRGEVILLEDIYESSLGRLTTRAHDVFVNKLMYPSISCPFTYRSRDGWHALFDVHRFELICEERIRSLPLNLQRQVLFRLRKIS
jgi:ubiquinone/menaquinone biosynthesis C-methylase UbiE